MRPSFYQRHRHDIGVLALLSATVVFVWAAFMGRLNPETWRTPIVYHGDGHFALTMIKLAQEGDLAPVGFINSTALGAPELGNLNDFPVPERTLYWFAGLLARLVGLGLAANLTEVTAHILAAGCFFIACRLWGRSRALSFLIALTYAFTANIMWRTLPHLGLSFYGLLPLQIYIAWYLATVPELRWSDRRFKMAILIGLMTSALSIYYTFMFLQFCGFALLRRLFRRHHLATALLVPGVTVLGSIAILSSYPIYSSIHGKNEGAVARIYGDVETVALKPLDLVLPPAGHAFGWFSEQYSTYLRFSARVLMESHTAYVGIIGVLGLALLFFHTLRTQFDRKALPWEALAVLWVVCFSMFGGLNALLALFTNFYLFRGTNRYSIVVVTLVLLFLVKQLDLWCGRWPLALRLLLFVPLTTLALFDQTGAWPKFYRDIQPAATATIKADQALAAQLEQRLPEGAMLFMLPMMDFPEVPPIEGLQDYELFRPFLFSTKLRYSYGTNKGRIKDAWQHDTAQLPAGEMAKTLESYGFSGILLNRKAFPNNGEDLVGKFAAAGRPSDMQMGEWVFIALTPSATPSLPKLTTRFNTQWMPEESMGEARWHWSSEKSGLKIQTYSRIAHDVPGHVTFTVGTLAPRSVELKLNGKPVQKLKFSGGGEQRVEFDVTLRPGLNSLTFDTDTPAVSANNGDPRLFTLRVVNFDLRVPEAEIVK